MIRPAEPVFVDTGAWIALAVRRDPHHARALAAWDELLAVGARLKTSVPVVIETFTFLDRNAAREAAIAWREGLSKLPWFELWECPSEVLQDAWRRFEGRRFHRLSVVDATSFVLMERHGIRRAFTFDTRFAEAGFLLIG